MSVRFFSVNFVWVGWLVGGWIVGCGLRHGLSWRSSSFGGQFLFFFGLEFVPRNYGIDNRHIPVMGL